MVVGGICWRERGTVRKERERGTVRKERERERERERGRQEGVVCV